MKNKIKKPIAGKKSQRGTFGKEPFKMTLIVIALVSGIFGANIILPDKAYADHGSDPNCTNWTQLKRYYHPSANKHLYIAEFCYYGYENSQRKHVEDQGFRYEGSLDGRIWSGVINSTSPDYTPLIRLYHSPTNKHFWTESAGERDFLVNQQGYRYEGGIGYVNKIRGSGTVNLKRYYHPGANKYFWTTNEAEGPWVESQGFRYEGVAAFLDPPCPCGH